MSQKHNTPEPNQDQSEEIAETTERLRTILGLAVGPEMATAQLDFIKMGNAPNGVNLTAEAPLGLPPKKIAHPSGGVYTVETMVLADSEQQTLKLIARTKAFGQIPLREKDSVIFTLPWTESHAIRRCVNALWEMATLPDSTPEAEQIAASDELSEALMAATLIQAEHAETKARQRAGHELWKAQKGRRKTQRRLRPD